MVLTNEEQDVIDEFLPEAKSKAEAKRRREKLRIFKVDEFLKRLTYDSTHGKYRSNELLINYILHMKANDPDNENIKLLEPVIPPLSDVSHFGLTMPGVCDSITCIEATMPDMAATSAKNPRRRTAPSHFK